MLPCKCRLWDSITIGSNSPKKAEQLRISPTERPHRTLRRLVTALARPALALPLLVALQAPVLAFDLVLPSAAKPSGERVEALASHAVATGPWKAGTLPTTTAEGSLRQTAWKLAGADRGTLDLLRPLRDQITAAGFATVFECESTGCGGFDFRYGIEILPEPEMHVDLGDFRFLAARRDGGNGPEWVTLIVSRSADTGFVQLTQIGAPVAGEDVTLSTKSDFTPDLAETGSIDPAPAALPANPVTGPVAQALSAGQAAVLEDLSFASGAADLTASDTDSLRQLANWLVANPDARVELVGHTDASGNAGANTALSLARAEAARSALLALADIDPARITARGAGPDSPRATNDTQEGRAQNRRVEAIPAPTL